MEETAQHYEKRFFLSGLRFSSPYQNFMPHIEIMKFCQHHWSLTALLLSFFRTERKLISNTVLSYRNISRIWGSNTGTISILQIFFGGIYFFNSADNKPFNIYYWLAVVDHSFYLSFSESKPCVLVLLIFIWYVNFSFCACLQIPYMA